MKYILGVLAFGIFIGIASCGAFNSNQPGASATTTPEIFMSLPADQHTFEVVRATLAGELGVDPSSVTLIDVTAVDWSDTCLGLAGQGEACAQVVTPGFRVRVQLGGTVYKFHTDHGAQNLRQVK